MLNYSIGRVWILLEEAEPVVPWEYLFPGTPHYYTVSRAQREASRTGVSARGTEELCGAAALSTPKLE